jgi:hypothetical protein
MVETLYIKRHDLQPYYKFIVVDPDDAPVNITGASIYATMRDVRTNSMAILHQSSGCYVTSGDGGCGEYRWQGSETALSGKYNIELEVVPAAGGKFTIPADPDEVAEVIILDDLDNQ